MRPDPGKGNETRPRFFPVLPSQRCLPYAVHDTINELAWEQFAETFRQKEVKLGRKIESSRPATGKRGGRKAGTKLQPGHFYFAGKQWWLHFDDMGGTSREISVRNDLQQFLFKYIDAAGKSLAIAHGLA